MQEDPKFKASLANLVTLCLKMKESWGYSSVIDCLHKALGLIPSIKKVSIGLDSKVSD
jgi:hypothetical protein